MNSRNHFIAEVPMGFRKQAIHWLVLEEDKKDTGGWYLYMHSNLNEGSEFDGWYLTRGEAEQAAEAQWGVKVGDWKA